MVRDAVNTELTVAEGDIILPTNILRIDSLDDSDTLVFEMDGMSFYGGDITVNPIHTHLEEGSLFSAYVKDADGNTLESFEDEPLVFECIEYYIDG